MYINPRLFHEYTFVEESDLVVALMPFRPEWSSDVFNVFEEAVKEKGFRIWRSDVEFKDDIIIQTIWEYLNKAKFIIADCTGQNPNVFYELGIAHTLGKRVFICAQDRKDFPFDIVGVRNYQYGLIPSRLKELKKTLQKFIDGL